MVSSLVQTRRSSEAGPVVRTGACTEEKSCCSAVVTSMDSETGRWLLTEEPIVRDITCCAIYAGNIDMLLVSSN